MQWFRTVHDQRAHAELLALIHDAALSSEDTLSSVHGLRWCIEFREHAELRRAMLSDGAWSREHMLSFVQKFGTVR
jgi:hypothetical protein